MNDKKIRHDENVHRLGDETSRYLTLKALCKRQNELIKSLYLEIGFLKSELVEANDKREYYRDQYLELKYDKYESENLEEF